MKQEDKDLLLKDLCARLLYGFIVHRYSDNASIRINNISEFGHFLEYSEGEDFKPYLRPMSSMTEEEKEDFELIREWSGELNGIGGYYVEVDDASKYIDFLNSHQFDYRGLIEKGLALEAPEGMYQ